MKTLMKLALATTMMTSVASTAAVAEEIKLAVMMGFTGPLESLMVSIGLGAELAISEVSDSGALLDGATVVAVRGDTTCVDASVATAVAERMITSEGVKGIVGAACSGATTAALQNVAMPNGMVMISPAATSPALTTVEDNGLFFRTAPSDARQGEIAADILMDKGVKSIAVTYTNNDYGKGLADAITANFEKNGGEVTIVTAHEDGRGDYSAEVGALASAGGDILVVVGYIDQGGRGIIQSALDSGAFETFYLPDGMIGDALPEAIGPDLDGSYGANPSSEGPGADAYAGMAETAGFKIGPYSAEAYDAAALIMLAMQAAGSTESADYQSKILDVANAPGEQIFAGELAKGLEILKNGGEIDYQGGSAVELIGPGESAGSYREIVIEDGAVKAVGFR